MVLGLAVRCRADEPSLQVRIGSPLLVVVAACRRRRRRRRWRRWRVEKGRETRRLCVFEPVGLVPLVNVAPRRVLVLRVVLVVVVHVGERVQSGDGAHSRLPTEDVSDPTL